MKRPESTTLDEFIKLLKDEFKNFKMSKRDFIRIFYENMALKRENTELKEQLFQHHSLENFLKPSSILRGRKIKKTHGPLA